MLELNGSRIDALFASGQTEAGLAAAQALLKHEIARVGEKHFDYGLGARHARGRAVCAPARTPTRSANSRRRLPFLLAASRENADDDDTTVIAGAEPAAAGHRRGLYRAAGAHAGRRQRRSPPRRFSLADSIRGHSVQQALAASSARASAKDPALAELVRNEQDLGKQVDAQLGAAQQPAGAAVRRARRQAASRRSTPRSTSCARDRDKARAGDQQALPRLCRSGRSEAAHASTEIKATLADGEAMLSFYFGRDGSFRLGGAEGRARWRSRRSATSGDIESKVRKLREALEPQAAMISDIPPFDLALGYELYSLLLEAGRGGLEAVEEPDRRHQRRARPVAAVAVADGARDRSIQTTIRCSRATATCPGWRGPMRSRWCRRRRRCARLRQLAAGQAGARRVDRLRRSAFQQRTGRRSGAAGAGGSPIRWRMPPTATTRGMPLKRRSSSEARGRRQRRTWPCCRDCPTPPMS